MLVIGDIGDRPIPTCAARATFTVLFWRRACMARDVIAGGDRASVLPCLGRWSVNHWRRYSERDILGQVANLQNLGPYLIFLRRNPMLLVRRCLAYVQNIEAHPYVFDVPGIKPAEFWRARPVQQRDHARDKIDGMEEVFALFHFVDDIRHAIHALAGIAVMADRTWHLGKLTARDAFESRAGN